MRVIPVIDLKNGLVVHAKLGQRQSYSPIHSNLCQSPLIEDVLAAYLTLYPFKIIYIADLDAIIEHKPQTSLIRSVLSEHPDLTFWIDSGFLDQPAAYPHLNYVPVLGSEAYTTESISVLDQFAKNAILSLDFSAESPLGAQQLFQRTDYWPQQIIIMTLQRVGSDQGPDLKKLQHFKQNYPHYEFIAAGGIRNRDDLLALQASGVESALVASALHSGAIGREDLQLCVNSCPT